MKKYLVVILILLFSVDGLVSLYPIFDYHINKSYIAKNLCENRDKPELHCEGSCHMEKEIKEIKGGKPEDAGAILFTGFTPGFFFFQDKKLILSFFPTLQSRMLVPGKTGRELKMSFLLYRPPIA